LLRIDNFSSRNKITFQAFSAMNENLFFYSYVRHAGLIKSISTHEKINTAVSLKRGFPAIIGASIF